MRSGERGRPHARPTSTVLDDSERAAAPTDRRAGPQRPSQATKTPAAPNRQLRRRSQQVLPSSSRATAPEVLRGILPVHRVNPCRVRRRPYAKFVSPSSPPAPVPAATLLSTDQVLRESELEVASKSVSEVRVEVGDRASVGIGVGDSLLPAGRVNPCRILPPRHSNFAFPRFPPVRERERPQAPAPFLPDGPPRAEQEPCTPPREAEPPPPLSPRPSAGP
ncbi:hypothetical protein HRbin29_01628 [bacterium HR29]|nr:hypothetical protein HRbin29_01628 [bacterium HR29]